MTILRNETRNAAYSDIWELYHDDGSSQNANLQFQSPHGGCLTDIYHCHPELRSTTILDFSANINPLGIPKWVPARIAELIPQLAHYPDPHCRKLVAAMAQRYNCHSENVVVGNGSTEILAWLPFALPSLRRAIIPIPSYADYARSAQNAGIDILEIPPCNTSSFAVDFKQIAAVAGPGDIIFIGRPNNPTGRVEEAATIRSLARAMPETFWVIDEAFGDFVDNFESMVVDRPANVTVLLSLTKIFALPGLRIAGAIADANLVTQVRQRQPFWSVNTLAEAIGAEALADQDFYTRTRNLITPQRNWLTNALGDIPGVDVHPGVANFLLLQLQHCSATLLTEYLLEYGIAIRNCNNFAGLNDNYIRVAVRTHKQNHRLVKLLRVCLEEITR